ncbi:MAG: hypothetical protein OEW93_06565 [Candidatus Bathyarchaeota archaeon]|nr:hypothetical protein [Candidatus Bathyarchaeota archaeon]MDH5792815.1 hypothetical protein [Candidatus Bathyarchaeota archaeon]
MRTETRRVLSFSIWVGGCALIAYLLITRIVSKDIAILMFLGVLVLTGILMKRHQMDEIDDAAWRVVP